MKLMLKSLQVCAPKELFLTFRSTMIQLFSTLYFSYRKHLVVHSFFHACTSLMYEIYGLKKGGLLFKRLVYFWP